jgi:uncharacterized protein (TIRG00374 family)
MVGAAKNPFTLLFSAAMLLLVVVLAQYAASRPGALDGVGVTAIRLFNRIRGQDPDNMVDRWHKTVKQISAVRMTRGDDARALGWSMFNWVCDAACLAFACYSIGGYPSIAGLAVAYAISNTAKSALPLMPAGLGVMEVTLMPTLTAAGLTGGQALSAVFVYRVVSFLLIAAIGWIVFACRFRGMGTPTAAEESEQKEEMRRTWGDGEKD